MASVAEPVSVNGVRSGIVYPAGADTTGIALPVGVMMPPLFVTAPPVSSSFAKPDMPVVAFVTVSRYGTFVAAWVPPKLTPKPWLFRPLMLPPPNAVSVDGRAGRQDRRERGREPGLRVVRAVHDRRRRVAVEVERERVVRPAVVRLVHLGEAAAAVEVLDREVPDVGVRRGARVGHGEARSWRVPVTVAVPAKPVIPANAAVRPAFE